MAMIPTPPRKSIMNGKLTCKLSLCNSSTRRQNESSKTLLHWSVKSVQISLAAFLDAVCKRFCSDTLKSSTTRRNLASQNSFIIEQSKYMILNRYKLELTTALFPCTQLEEGFNLHRVVLLAPSILNIESLHAVRSNTWEPGAICKSLCSNRFESDGPPSVEVLYFELKK